jgi:cytochrome c553
MDSIKGAQNMQKTSVILTALLLTMVSAVAMAGGDAAAGKAKSATCAACHGNNGMSVNPTYPKLAGQHAQYIVKALKAYQAGVRGDPTMKAMAAPLSDADIDNLAAYYSGQACK